MGVTAELGTKLAARPDRGCTQERDHLADLLGRAGAGDERAFMEFYDRTSGVAYRAMLQKYGDAAAAQAATQVLYLRAWTSAAEHAASGLSPLAWLLVGLRRPAARAS